MVHAEAQGYAENANGLLPQYFRGGSDLSHFSQWHLNRIALRLNQRPRKTWLVLRRPVEPTTQSGHSRSRLTVSRMPQFEFPKLGGNGDQRSKAGGDSAERPTKTPIKLGRVPLPTTGTLAPLAVGASTPSAWTPWTTAFVQRLRELGWIEGRTVTIEYRWAETRRTLSRNCGGVRSAQGRCHRARLPTVHPVREYLGAGGLMSYGAKNTDLENASACAAVRACAATARVRS